MTDFKMTAGWDLDVSTGDLQIVDGLEETLQRLRFKYQFFLGEWFLDQRQGIPYFRDVLIKSPRMSVVSALLQDVARKDPGVSRVVRLDLDFDNASRLLTVTLDAIGIDGDSFTFEFEEFLLGRGTVEDDQEGGAA